MLAPNTYWWICNLIRKRTDSIILTKKNTELHLESTNRAVVCTLRQGKNCSTRQKQHGEKSSYNFRDSAQRLLSESFYSLWTEDGEGKQKPCWSHEDFFYILIKNFCSMFMYGYITADRYSWNFITYKSHQANRVLQLFLFPIPTFSSISLLFQWINLAINYPGII